MTGISLANQEDTARATEDERARDVAYHRDFAAIVEALRIGYQHAEIESRAFVREALLEEYIHSRNPDAHDLSFFASQWGFPALLRALARAIELETAK